MVSIFNAISDYVIVLNKKGKIKFCNESLLKRLNYSNEEIENIYTSKIIKNYNSILESTDEIKTNIELYLKSEETINVNSTIKKGEFDNEESIFIIGKEESKPYTIEMLEDLLNNLNMCTFIKDSNGKYLYVNDVFANMINKKKEDIIGTYNKEHWALQDYEVFDRNDKEVFEMKRPKISSVKVKLGDEYYWYETYKAPVYNEDGNAKYVIASAKNINLTRMLSEELYRNYNRVSLKSSTDCEKEEIDLKEVLTNIGENILEYTQANGMSIFLYNKNIEGLESIIKLKDAKKYVENVDFIPLKNEETSLGKYKKRANRVLKKSDIAELSIVNYSDIDNVEYMGNYTIELYNEFIGVIGLSYNKGNEPKFNSDEYMIYICNKIAMIIKNIRLLNEVHIENRKRICKEKELERYLNISVDLVAILSKDGKLKQVNSNWNKVLGWEEDELLGMKIKDIIHPKQSNLHVREQKKMSYTVENQCTRDVIKVRKKDGEYIQLEWNSEFIKDEEIYIVAARDLTKYIEIEKEKKKLEEEIKLETVKNEFFSTISHEFRTPINIILGTMQVINKNIEQNNISITNLSKYTKYIRQNSYRLLKLVNNLIDISKMDIGMYELRSTNQNIISIIEEITLSVADYTKDNNINLIFDTDSEEVITYCDPDKIERIMLNILSNAIKYTRENGFIKVEITTNKDYVEISIKDNGIGIPKNKIDIIFDRFGQVDDSYNRACEGSGIGLSLVKNLVNMHKGKIDVVSDIGQGAEFIFTIPIVVKEQTNKEYVIDRKSKHVERCEIEFSDIYTI